MNMKSKTAMSISNSSRQADESFVYVHYRSMKDRFGIFRTIVCACPSSLAESCTGVLRSLVGCGEIGCCVGVSKKERSDSRKEDEAMGAIPVADFIEPLGESNLSRFKEALIDGDGEGDSLCDPKIDEPNSLSPMVGLPIRVG